MVLGIVPALVMGCTSNPPTVTPAVPTQPVGSAIEMTVNPPPGAPSGPVIVPTLQVPALVPYSEPAGLYSVSVPAGWTAQPQPITQSDARVGTLFSAPERTGIVTVTQFDNGERPTVLGATANQILELTGVTKLPGYMEVSRSNVIERPEEAVKVELVYTRSDGVPMHALVLFQLDGTTMSMVNAGVEEGSWAAASPVLHDILSSYRVPAAPVASP
jgi:hypothetical protein